MFCFVYEIMSLFNEYHYLKIDSLGKSDICTPCHILGKTSIKEQNLTISLRNAQSNLTTVNLILTT